MRIGRLWSWGIGLAWLLAGSTAAQSVYSVEYRPRDVRYDLVRTGHFDLIYQRGIDTLAIEAADVLERAFDPVANFIGLSRRFRMPVVLNDFKDNSNGTVSPVPFVMEVEASPIKGKILSPTHRNWMEQVMPHELAHAVHAEVRPALGMGALLGLGGRDFSRVINFIGPPGWTEGLATYFESQDSTEAGLTGRLHFGVRAMEYDAGVSARRPLRLAGALSRSRYTQRFNRFYVGGARFVQYLSEAYGTEAIQKTLRTYHRWPYFGLGFALRLNTGKWTDELGAEFEADALAQLGERFAGQVFSDPEVVWSEPGLNARRPRWLDGKTLLVHASAYDRRPGFYRVDVDSRDPNALAYESVTEDFHIALSADRDTAYFAQYVPDPFVSSRRLSDLFALNTRTGSVKRLTRKSRLYAPVPTPDGLWALRNRGQYAQWVAVGDSVLGVTPAGAAVMVKDIALAPEGERVAALLNIDGRQGLYRCTQTALDDLEPWVEFASGSVYDPVWTPDGRFIVFAADPAGVANIYALDAQSGEVVQLTNVRFGAIEPAVSPDGTSLSFVRLQNETYEIAVMPFTPEQGRIVPELLLRAGRAPAWAPRPLPAIDWAERRPYRAWRYLFPRAFVPIASRARRADREADVDLGWQVGLNLSGVDPLQSWAYGVTGYYQANSVWGEASLQTGRSPLLPRLSAYRDPFTRLARVRTGDQVDTLRIGFEERGVALNLGLPVVLESNVFFSAVRLGLNSEIRQVRRIDGRSNPLGDFQNRLTFTPSVTLQYKLQQNIRDLQPNAGLVVSSFAELDATGDGSLGRSWLTRGSLYVPILMQRNISLRLRGGLLWQNRGSILNLDTFVPRGYAGEVFLGEGTFVKGGLETRIPLTYLDDGFLTVPFVLHTLYAYGFAERIGATSTLADGLTSVGAGLGIQFTVAHIFTLDLRASLAYKVEAGEWDLVTR